MLASPWGVPTAMKITSLLPIAPARLAVNSTVPSLCFASNWRELLFEDRHSPLTERLELCFVIVHADEAVAHLGKLTGCDQSNISGHDHTDRS